jgi:hypothetical protein
MKMSCVLAAFVLTIGCATPSDVTGVGHALQLPGHLVQRVTLSPAAPAPGQNVSIRSVISNTGFLAASLSSRVCGLDFGGDLKLTWPPNLGKCAAYSMSGDLAPADSVLGFDTMRVDSPPGEYTLRVRHALSPEGWYELRVRVGSVAP